MPNDYYSPSFTGQRHALVKAEHFEAMDGALEAAFDKLPRLRALLEDRVTAVRATGGPTNYTVTMDRPPTEYTDGMALQVRFPVANAANPNLDILNPEGVRLGAKPIKQVDGTDLTPGHVARHARAELYYVAEGAGYWTLGAGARGARGETGPPDGTFSINASKELVFTPTGSGGPTNLGKVAFLWRDDYAAGTTYKFLDIVRASGRLYLHVGLADTTGTPVTDTAVWQELARDGDDGSDAALRYLFSASTSISNPVAGDVRLNNASPASVTSIAIDDIDADSNDLGGYWATLDDTGIAGNHGMLFIRDRGDRDLLVYKVTAVADNSGWSRLTVSHVAGTSLPADNAALDVWFQPSGPSPIRVLTQAQYDAISVKDPATFYYIRS